MASPSLPMLLRRLTLAALLALLPFALTFAQGQQEEVQDQQLPNVYLDCSGYCFQDYVRSNITFINFVRDQADAQVHLFITDANTGSGGSEYTLNFIGRGEYESRTDTLVYTSAQSDTQDEERAGLVRYIKMGLAPYVVDSPLLQYADLTVDPPGDSEQQQQQQEDKWNYWVFETDVSGQYSGEDQQQSYQLGGGFSANRTTHDWKIDLEADYNYERDHFEFDDREDVTSTSIRKSFEGLVVRSLGPHWSAGLSGNIGSSTFSNIEWEYGGSPTLEYNVFPYREFQRRELLFQYQVTPTYNNYRDTTIFNKTEEFLVEQSLEVSLDVNETWGSVNASVEGSHYFHDTSQNRLTFRTNLNLRITRGLDLSLELDYSLINDQITLPKGDLDDEEIFLRRRDLATSYNFGAEIGLSFTFGSIYNSIVNPRLGGGGRF
ncbi:MAG: DUF481 domain-containing protein [Balneolaceae bacterium]|nr:DUF481 domain-containing protein [Balneolaceae bacterium]